MKKKKSKFNPNRPLPQELTIPSANDKFFKIGLSDFNFGDAKRSLINNPILILIVNTIVITRSVIYIIEDKRFEWRCRFLKVVQNGQNTIWTLLYCLIAKSINCLLY